MLASGDGKGRAEHFVSWTSWWSEQGDVLCCRRLWWPRSHWEQDPAAAGPFPAASTVTFYNCVYAVLNYSIRLFCFSFPWKLLYSVRTTRIQTLFVLVFLWVVAAGHSNPVWPPLCRACKFSESSMANSWSITTSTGDPRISPDFKL